MILLCCIALVPNLPSYGHLYGFNYQDWKNPSNNIHIQFDTTPSTPSVGKNSTMIFSVQNLKTGEHLKDFKETITVVNSPEPNLTPNGLIHKFETTTINGTDFSQDYVFPSGGTYYVWLRIDTSNAINIAKFTVFVSSPQFQFLNMGLILLPVIIVIVIFAAILITVAHYIYKKKSK
ncbi:MAG: hypothetical protein ACREA1_00610 [Nitrosotalea sp.]